MIRLLSILVIAALLSGCEAQDIRQAMAGGPAELSAATGDAPAEVGPRRVWSNSGDYATPSPDGRLVTFVDWSTGDVAVHDIRTGEDRRITDKGTWTENGSWAEEPLFSPDGERVAYSYGNVLTGDPFRYELRLVELGDTTQHLLYALDEGDDWIGATDWSEHAGILVEVNRAEKTELGILDPERTTLEVLKTVRGDEPHPHDASFSPDARHVVYREHDTAVVRPVQGDGESRLDIRVNWVLGWAPDGRGVMVHTNHDGRSGIWLAPVRDHGFTGQLRLIRGGIPSLGPGGFADGAYYYSVTVDAPKVYMAAIDVESGRIQSAPTAVTSPVDGAAMHTTWSPDGGSLAYALRTANREVRLMVRSANGDAVRELAAFNVQRIHDLVWSTDGRSLYVILDDSHPTLERVDVQSGMSETVDRPFPARRIAAMDARTLVFSRPESPRAGTAPGIYSYHLETGAAQRLVELEPGAGAPTLSVSPDGRRIATVVRNPETDVSRVMIAPVDGGPSRVVARANHPVHFEPNLGRLPWTPDGEHLLVGRGEWGAPDTPHELLAVSVDGGEIRRLAFERFPGQNAWPTLHPDGRRLAYVGGQFRQELWVLEDLTPQP